MMSVFARAALGFLMTLAGIVAISLGVHASDQSVPPVAELSWSGGNGRAVVTEDARVVFADAATRFALTTSGSAASLRTMIEGAERESDTPYAGPFSFGSRPDGMYYLLFWDSQVYARTGLRSVTEVYLDRTPPDLNIAYRSAGDAGSSGPLFLDANAMIAVAAEDEVVGVERLEWRLDGGAFSEVTGPIVVGAVAPRPGPHVLEVKATDRLGHERTWIGCFVRSASRAEWERAREEQERIEETRWRLRGAVASIDRAQGLVTFGVRYGNAPSVVRSGAPNPALGTTARIFRSDGVEVPVEVTPAQPQPPTISLGPGAAHEVSLRVKARDGVLAPGPYVLVLLLGGTPVDALEVSL